MSGEPPGEDFEAQVARMAVEGRTLPDGPLLALDVGNKRIGVAASDPLRLLARSLTTIERQSTNQAVEEIVGLVRRHAPVALLVGLPRNMDGSLGAQARSVLLFARRLEARIEPPVLVWDERLSTVGASEILSAQGVRAREQKGRLDAVAAAVILQEFMDNERAEQGDFALLPPDENTEPGK
ncbi:MAG: Holliday junction resolvase RuvX [Anaerolineae bacterium]